MIYQCGICGHQSGYTERDKALCRYCNKETTMTLLSKEDLTPQAIATRLKEMADSMMRNLESAYDSMTDEDKKAFGEEDAEKKMLDLLASTQKIREKINNLKLIDPDKEEES